MVEIKKARERHAKNPNFGKEVRAIIKTLNDEAEIERRLRGGWVKRRETLKSFSLKVSGGTFSRRFSNLRQGIDLPSFGLVKKILEVLPWEESRLLGVAQKLFEAAARDTGRISVDFDLKDPEARMRITLLARDAALEAIAQKPKEQS